MLRMALRLDASLFASNHGTAWPLHPGLCQVLRTSASLLPAQLVRAPIVACARLPTASARKAAATRDERQPQRQPRPRKASKASKRQPQAKVTSPGPTATQGRSPTVELFVLIMSETAARRRTAPKSDPNRREVCYRLYSYHCAVGSGHDWMPAALRLTFSISSGASSFPRPSSPASSADARIWPKPDLDRKRACRAVWHCEPSPWNPCSTSRLSQRQLRAGPMTIAYRWFGLASLVARPRFPSDEAAGAHRIRGLILACGCKGRDSHPRFALEGKQLPFCPYICEPSFSEVVGRHDASVSSVM
ncbi:hypothetical protein CCMA1212_003718 [Trichoderma ghanense]|uniref:Uncharacterized protein n=1 Tax=Trichoderma ghanense TaxID=65468 RepID=A0ABY2H8M6_9HYPO